MLYGVATGPTRDAVGLDARLRRMLRGTVVVRGKAPFPVRTVLPLVTPSEGAGEVQTTAAPPTMTLRAPAAAAQDPAVPAPLAASVNGAVNGASNGSVNGSVNGSANGAANDAVNGSAVNGAVNGMSRRNGASTTGGSSTTGAARNDASRTGAGKPPRGVSATRRQRAANGTGASVPFPPGATNGAALPRGGRSGGVTGATPLSQTGATQQGHTGANPLGPNGAGRPRGVRGANRLGPAAAAVPPGPGAHPTGNTGANPLGSTGASFGPVAAGHPGHVPGVPGPGTTGTTPFGDTGVNPLGLDGAGRSGSVTGVNRSGSAADGRSGDPADPRRGPSGANPSAGTTGAGPLGRNGVRGPAGTPGVNRLGPAAADFAGGTTGEHQAGPPTAEYRLDADDGLSPSDATWSGAHPLGAVPEPGTSPYGVPSGGAQRHHPVSGTPVPDGFGSALPAWPPTHSATPVRPTGSHPVAGPTSSATTGAHLAPDVAPWAAAHGDSPGPAGPPLFTSSLGSGRSEVPTAWAHESGVARPSAASFSVDDLVGDRAEPSVPWEPSPPPVNPSLPQAPEPARPPLSEPRRADRQPPSVRSGRDVGGRWDPLVDPLPIALDPLPAAGPPWTDGSPTAAPRRRDRDGDAAGFTNSAATPRWRAADLLRDRDRDAAADGSSDRWRAADLIAGRDDKPETTSTGRKWLAADLLADRERTGTPRPASGRSPASERGGAPESGRDGGAHGADDGSTRRGRRGTYDDGAGPGSHGVGATERRRRAADDGAGISSHGVGAAGRRRGTDDDRASGRRGAGGGAAATDWGYGDDGTAASGPGFGGDTEAGGYGADVPRWRAADLLDGAEPRTNGRARRRGAESAADPRVNGHGGASHAGTAAVPRWRAADLLREGRFDGTAAETRAPVEPAVEPRRSRAHDRDNATASTWQAAELLDGPAPYAEPARSARWSDADLPETGRESAGSTWRAADLLDRRDDGMGASAQRHSSGASASGQRHAPPPPVDVRPDPVPADDTPHRHGGADTYTPSPSRVPPTQWAWPKEPEAAPDPLPPVRADGGRRSAWAAADLLDQGAHAGGRRRARETAKHGKPDDEDAGRHYRP